MSEIILDPFEQERLGKSKTIDVIAFMKLDPYERERILETYVQWMETLGWHVKPFIARTHGFGAQLVFKLPNGFGLSVIFGHCSYGYPNSFEAAPLVWADDGEKFVLATEYSDDDVMGYLSVDGVNDAIKQVSQITDDNGAVFAKITGIKSNIATLIEQPSIFETPDEETGTF